MLRAGTSSTSVEPHRVTLIRRFTKDGSGAIAPIFAAALSGLLLVIGTTVEYGRRAIARAELQIALDAAVLAGASKLQQNSADKAAAIAAGKAAFDANRAKRRFAGDIAESIDISVTGNTVVAKGTANISTVLANIVGVNTLPLLGVTKSQPGGGSAIEAEVGAEASITNSHFEISIMLDITGSMCDDPQPTNLSDAPCTSAVKLNAMKNSAISLVNTMLATEEMRNRIRIAIVPFSDGVRLPSAPRLVAAGSTPSVKSYTYNEVYYNSATRRYESRSVTEWYHPTECVAERTGNDKYNDAAPGSGNYVMTAMRQGKSQTDSTAMEFGCSLGTASTVMPLTNKKDDLIAKINSLAAKGGTAGHLGTAWAWYVLSPNWKNVWSGSDDDAAAYPAANDKTLRKIAVLMTDGDYNNQYALGGYKVGSTPYDKAANAASTTQASELCTGMKNKNIEVFTVGFQVSSAAKTFLEGCATPVGHAFMADSPAQLAAAFQGIGRQVLSLYLSK